MSVPHEGDKQWKLCYEGFPPYAENDKSCIMKFVAWDVSVCSLVFPKVSLSLLSICRPSSEEAPLGPLYPPYVNDISEKFKHMGNRYDTGKNFKTKQTLRSSLTQTRTEGCPQQIAQVPMSIFCGHCRSKLVHWQNKQPSASFNIGTIWKRVL
jgi:hypothetical protein